MNPNQTLSSRPRLSLRSIATTWSGCANGHNVLSIRPRASSSPFRYATSCVGSTASVGGGRDRARQDVDQRTGHLDSDGADDDALDPLLCLQRRLRLDRGDLPQEGKYESQSADRPDQGLADMRPGEDEVGDRRNVWCRLENVHANLLAFYARGYECRGGDGTLPVNVARRRDSRRRPAGCRGPTPAAPPIQGVTPHAARAARVRPRRGSPALPHRSR